MGVRIREPEPMLDQAARWELIQRRPAAERFAIIKGFIPRDGEARSCAIAGIDDAIGEQWQPQRLPPRS